jgi:2-C-methyl-D-erythritol 2,4-cyclodiphosphate synthase
VADAGYRVNNVDATVVLQEPRLREHKPRMRAVISEDLDLPLDSVSVKAKTKEGVDAVGQGKAVEAYAVVSLRTAEELPDPWV